MSKHEFKRGDKVTNVCAGEGNPFRHAYFVSHLVKTKINKWGIPHTYRWIRVRAGGKTSLFDPRTIHPGWLSPDEAKPISKAIWEAEHEKRGM